MNENENNVGRFAGLDMDLETIQIDADGLVVEPTAPIPLPLEIDGVTVPPCDEGIGVGIAQRAMEKAGLDFEVRLVRPEYPINELPFNSSWATPPNIDEYRMCCRMDTGRVFGIVSPDYGFVQPQELAATVDAALPEGAGEVHCYGSAFGDMMVFDCELPLGCVDIGAELQAQANQQKWIHLDPRDPEGNIPVKGKLLFKHHYGGQGSYDVSMLFEAKVCANGLCVPLMDGKRALSIRHTTNFAERVAQLRHAFEVAGNCVPVFAGMMSEMVGTKITMAQFDAYCEHLFPGTSTQAKNKRERLGVLYQGATGAAPDTAWGALQAATFYGTHEMPVRVGGRSLRRYTLANERDLNEAQLDGIRRQARLEQLVDGEAGALTNRAYQYVTNYMLDMN